MSSAALLYFGLWLQGWGVPGIDHGAASGFAALIDVLLVGAFGLIHSVMARPAFKRAWARIVPPPLERATYLLIAGVTLAALCLWWQPMPEPIWAVDGNGASALIGLYLLGVAIIGWAVLTIDPLHFFGLKQAFGARDEPPFAMRGPYRIVRHPIQTGLILMLWATPAMSHGHLVLALAFTAYSIAATLGLEERDLRRTIGNDYDDYRRRVPALLPFWPRRH